MAKKGVARAPLLQKNYAGNVALCRIVKRLSYTEIHGIYEDGLIPGDMLYSIFFILCSINKKKRTFIFIDIYRGKGKIGV
jgi:hypothetical protein